MTISARGRWPLRRRLMLIMLAVVTGVLLSTVAGFATTVFGVLYTDVDERLRDAHRAVSTTYPDAPTDGDRAMVFTDVSIEVIGRQGATVRVLQRQNRSSPPAPSAASAARAVRARAPITINDAGTGWRLLAAPLPDGTWLLAGQPVTSLQGLHTNLVLIWVGAAAVILLVTALLTTHLIQYGLRPLTEIAGIAGQIEAGDLSPRLPVASRDEVGQVAAALNRMLDHIQASFARRQAVEDRLRRFVHDAGHELRTPVTAIRGWVDLYRAGAIAHDGLPTAMRRIADEAQRVSTLVEELLLLASLDDPAAASPVAADSPQRVVDLAEIVRDAVLDAQAVEPDRPITSQLPAPGVAAVHGDPAALHQVVANLLGNVRAHTPAGTPARVDLERVAAPGGDRVVLRVADEGPGVPGDVRDKVFDRFFRADRGRTHRGHGGTGLGLSIVAALITSHGGDVRTEPVETGFTVRITLPAAH